MSANIFNRIAEPVIARATVHVSAGARILIHYIPNVPYVILQDAILFPYWVKPKPYNVFKLSVARLAAVPIQYILGQMGVDTVGRIALGSWLATYTLHPDTPLIFDEAGTLWTGDTTAARAHAVTTEILRQAVDNVKLRRLIDDASGWLWSELEKVAPGAEPRVVLVIDATYNSIVYSVYKQQLERELLERGPSEPDPAGKKQLDEDGQLGLSPLERVLLDIVSSMEQDNATQVYADPPPGEAVEWDRVIDEMVREEQSYINALTRDMEPPSIGALASAVSRLQSLARVSSGIEENIRSLVEAARGPAGKVRGSYSWGMTGTSGYEYEVDASGEESIILDPIVRLALSIDATVANVVSRIRLSYYRRDRRVDWVILPGPTLRPDPRPRIIIGMDVSGSISEYEAKRFVKILRFLLHSKRSFIDLRNSKLVSWSTKIEDDEELLKARLGKVMWGGGTDPTSFFEYLLNEYDDYHARATMVVVLTDGWFRIDDRLEDAVKRVKRDFAYLKFVLTKRSTMTFGWLKRIGVDVEVKPLH